MTQMTVELLKATLPKALQGSATQELADKINNIALDPEVAEEVRENFLTYTKVLQEGKFKTESYLDAIVYVTHKLMGYSNQDAYIRTFPQRYQALVARGCSAKDLSAYVAAYHANKLVNLILEQSIIPSWLLNRDIYQRAINTQFELMTDPNVSAKVRSDAANSILTHLKQPETKKLELEVGMKEAGGIADLIATMNQLARQQKELIQAGVPARAVARDPLIGRRVEAVTAEDVEYQEVSGSRAKIQAEAAAVGFAKEHSQKAVQEAPAGNHGVPPFPSSLFQPTGPSEDAPIEQSPSTWPGATAAQPPASAEGQGAGLWERGGDESRGQSAGESRGPSVSLFDPMPAEDEA